MESRLSDLVDGLAAAKSRAALEGALRHFANAFETDMFALVTSRATSVDGISNYPAEWQERYYRHQYVRSDPVVTTAKRIQAPFTWTADGLHCSSVEEAKVLHEASEHGIRAGVSIPVELPYGTLAMLTLASSRGTIGVDFRRYVAPCAVAICLASNLLINTSKVPPAKNPTELTMRQAQCLIWASHGKSASDTSCILGISESAVSFHIKEARKRLKAKSVAQAIRIAYDLGLIF